MRDTSTVITRLAAANSVPEELAAPDAIRSRIDRLSAESPRPGRRPRRRRLVAAVALAAVVLPGAAFAHQLGDALGLTNEGTPVATSSVPEFGYPKLAQALEDLASPGQMQSLGALNGYRFYATRNARGAFCFAIDGATLADGKGVGCGGSSFPSAAEPIAGFPAVADAPHVRLLGFAADGVASVELRDASGAALLAAPVADNLYAATADSVDGTPATLVALDSDGHVLFTQDVPTGK